MTRIGAILLMIIFSFQHLLQLSIYSWYQVNQTYISNFLCVNKEKPELQCNGHCQLALKLNSLDNNQPVKENTPGFKKIDLSFFLLFENCGSSNDYIGFIQYSDIATPKILDGIPSKVIHPPIIA